MKKIFLLLVAVLFFGMGFVRGAHAAFPVQGGCGTMCWAQIQNYCPTCNRGYYPGYNTMPWGAPTPWWWGTGPMMYSNFYSPAPWSYIANPGVMPTYYPGTGGMFAAKPNIYLEGPAGTEVSFKLKFTEPGANWLVSVPVHGREGWSGKLTEKKLFQTEGGSYKFLYTDYRMHGNQFQDEAGFCATRDKVVGKIAISMKQAGFNGREIADFMEYWTVKFPQSERYCVFPQDERQLETVAAFEVSPKPVAVRRILFMVQVQEAMNKGVGKFVSAPKREWVAPPIRMPAAEKQGLVIREWGVGFLSAKP